MFLPAAISLGFLGSMHCIGMCGPLVLALPVQQKKRFLVLLYHLGRITAYALMGLLFGLVGKGFVMAGWQNVLSIVLGSLILLFLFVPFFAAVKPRYGMLYKAVGRIKKGIGVLFGKTSPGALYLIGFLNGLLPCGLVYLAIAGSLAAGSATGGALFMAGFGLGTVPALLALFFLGRFIGTKLRSRLYRAVPYFAGLMAVLLILRGLNLGIPYVSPSVQTNASGTTVHSCCHK